MVGLVGTPYTAGGTGSRARAARPATDSGGSAIKIASSEPGIKCVSNGCEDRSLKPDCDARDWEGHTHWHACGEGKRGRGGEPEIRSKNPPHTSVLVRGVGQRRRAP